MASEPIFTPEQFLLDEKQANVKSCIITVVGGVGLTSTLGLKERRWGPASPLTFSLFGSTTNFDTPGILLNAAIANAPQIYLSLCYVTFNGLYTCIAMVYEWNAWATVRKGLRVTKAEGAQRSTYFLQLPYKWAVPLTITSGVLHWLMSETLFIVRADIRTPGGDLDDRESISACGYSLSSLLALVLVAFVLIFVTVYTVTRRVQQHIPFAAASSLVLSAACHPPPEDVDTHLKEVQWGVVDSFKDVGHCSFSSNQVLQPLAGNRYA
ncbi:hypothetical protein K432DRAFT_311957 [Lepidopterella palustris CBS 459.81]|uniref:Uncharacterized protein n=1 Tax=Lepidopterella palustris CBS 459.81 TaxID=1314670 RepID=A0A8E2DY83_9PEZI|nr:hypothetical protein K432DRAFT_311957 [Lepidopterella palustris CBS 459.81]